MSNFFLADRIKEYSRTEGTTSIVLDGAAPGFSSFDDFYASGDTVFYAITDNLKYEVGSGVYEMDGSSRVVTRNPFRSSQINSGPWYVNGTNSEDSSNGYFYPLWLTKSAALSGVGFNDGPYTAVSGVSFDEVPGQTFYYITEHAALAVNSLANSGLNFYDGLSIGSSSGQPLSFGVGLKEVFVTYPGKTAVYNGFGVDPNFEEPKVSGVAFWGNEQIINYSSDIIFDKDKGRLGVGVEGSPEYRLDIGGDRSRSIVRASGFIEGGSGIFFSGGQLLPEKPTKTASGGIQLEPFHRNQLGNAAVGILKLSGVVDQYIGFDKVPSGLVFAGPASGDCGIDPCDPDYPTFRLLAASDLPDLSSDYVVQNNAGLDGESKNVNPTLYANGMVALYAGSGEITYDSGLFFDALNNRLLINGDAATDTPTYELEVNGQIAAQSGRLDQLIFTDNLIRIGNNTGTKEGNNNQNFYVINIGANSGPSSSDLFDTITIGREAGSKFEESSGVVAIGKRAVQSADRIDETVVIATNAGQAASGLVRSVGIGFGALQLAENLADAYVVGLSAGSGMVESNDVYGFGVNAFRMASGISGSVGIGRNAFNGASGIANSYMIGNRPASGAIDFVQVYGIGGFVAGEASGLDNVTAIGKSAARYSEQMDNVIALGQNASLSGYKLYRTVAIGGSAAYEASGSFNVYIGQDAGISVSGHNNIEIIASGENSSFLTHEASGKINIGKTIVGDIYQSRVGVGAAENVSPSATLFVRPRNADEPAFIIQHQGSGSKTPYFALQSGDGTTFFSINNSGDVRTSGCVEASGGFGIPDKVPQSTTFKLYNDGGALYWDGNLLDTAGATTLKIAEDTENAAAPNNSTWTDGQLLTVSGVSGVEVQLGPANSRFIRISASGLSGVLQNQITNQTFGFQTVASGEGNLNNEPFSQLNVVGSVNEVVFSGISGINIDHKRLSDGGGNRSGIYIFGYDANATFSANLIASGEAAGGGRNKSRQLLLNGSGLAFSGVKGVDFSFSQDTDPQASIFTLDPSTLSGVLYDTTIASGNYIWEDHIDWRASGIAVSGQVVANTNAINAITTLSATSGIVVENDQYILDKNVGGQLSYLVLEDQHPENDTVNGSGNIFVSNTSGVPQRQGGAFPLANGLTKDSVLIGTEVAGNASGIAGDVFIGYKAGFNKYGRVDNLLGQEFGEYGTSEAQHRSIIIGYEAGYGTDDSLLGNPVQSPGNHILIGERAGSNAWDCGHNVAIGVQAMGSVSDSLLDSPTNQYSPDRARTVYASVFLGQSAGERADDLYRSVGIGYYTLNQSRRIDDTTAIGYNALEMASGIASSVYIGEEAGVLNSGSQAGLGTQNGQVGIGYRAWYQSNDMEPSVAVGFNAGNQTSGVKNSVLIGPYAGYKRGGSISKDTTSRNCILISNKSAIPTVYDADWCDRGENYVIDIGSTIQGFGSDPTTSQSTNINIGRPLENQNDDGIRNITNGLLSSTVSITPDSNSDYGLRLNLFDNDGGRSLLVTETVYNSSAQSNLNSIINTEGFLRVPRIASPVNKVSNALELTNGDFIDASDGAVAVGEDGGTEYIYFAVGTTWYRVAGAVV